MNRQQESRVVARTGTIWCIPEISGAGRFAKKAVGATYFLFFCSLSPAFHVHCTKLNNTCFIVLWRRLRAGSTPEIYGNGDSRVVPGYACTNHIQGERTLSQHAKDDIRSIRARYHVGVMEPTPRHALVYEVLTQDLVAFWPCAGGILQWYDTCLTEHHPPGRLKLKTTETVR